MYFYSAVGTLNITGGIAYCTASADCLSSINKIYISMYLQKSSSGSWVTQKHWSQTTNSSSASLNKSYAVNSGSYRNLCYFYAYINDVCVETATRCAYKSC